MKKQDLQESFREDCGLTVTFFGLTVTFLTAFLQKMAVYSE